VEVTYQIRKLDGHVCELLCESELITWHHPRGLVKAFKSSSDTAITINSAVKRPGNRIPGQDNGAQNFIWRSSRVTVELISCNQANIRWNENENRRKRVRINSTYKSIFNTNGQGHIPVC
jgi:hypothetical protein